MSEFKVKLKKPVETVVFHDDVELEAPGYEKVVYCRDCIYFNQGDMCHGAGTKYFPDENDYCSTGERNE